MMTIGQMLLPESDLEMAKTRTIMACVPDGKFDWAPHVRSFTLGELVNRIAVIPSFAAMIVHGQRKRADEAQSKEERWVSCQARCPSWVTGLSGVACPLQKLGQKGQIILVSRSAPSYDARKATFRGASYQLG